MRYIIIFIITFAFVPACLAQSVERQVTASAGMSVSAGSVQMDYTIGELVTLPASTANLLIVQGFNQPSSNNMSVKTISASQYVSVYPNPTAGLINLEAKQLESPAVITVCDITGKIVAQQVWQTLMPGTLDGSAWTTGVYTIHIQVADKQLLYTVMRL